VRADGLEIQKFEEEGNGKNKGAVKKALFSPFLQTLLILVDHRYTMGPTPANTFKYVYIPADM
jgi:hypothetical protein